MWVALGSSRVQPQISLPRFLPKPQFLFAKEFFGVGGVVLLQGCSQYFFLAGLAPGRLCCWVLDLELSLSSCIVAGELRFALSL